MKSINSDEAEQVIRDIAGTVLSLVQTRNHHPAYGVTKTMIRAEVNRMDGAIGLYMVLTGQASHSRVPYLADFEDDSTERRVNEARKVANTI